MTDQPTSDKRSSQTYLFAGRWPLGGKMHKVWWRYSDRWAGDYLSVWRPLCWFVSRSHEEHYGACIVCGKPMRPTPANGGGERG